MMRTIKLFSAAAVCAFMAAPLSGCIVDASAEPVPVPLRSGELTVKWSVVGGFSAAACDRYGADLLELSIFDNRGRHYLTTTTPCESFRMTVPLLPGYYSAEAKLIDRRSRAVTTTLPMADIRITEDTELTINIDFQRSSIL